MKIVISLRCEAGLNHEVSQARQEDWLAENREAIGGWNDYVEAQGLPLAAFRPF